MDVNIYIREEFIFQSQSLRNKNEMINIVIEETELPLFTTDVLYLIIPDKLKYI